MITMKHILLALLALALIVIPVSAAAEFSPEFGSDAVVHYNMTYDYAMPGTTPIPYMVFFATLGVVLLFMSIPPMPGSREVLWPICSIPPLLIAAWHNLNYDVVVGSGAAPLAFKSGGVDMHEWVFMEHHLIYQLWPGTIVFLFFLIIAMLNIYRILMLPSQIDPDEESD